MGKPKIQSIDEGKYQVTIGIDRYDVFDFPIENEQQEKEIQKLVKEKPLSLIDYWAIDWDYDGITFKSTWHTMRQIGRNIQTIPKSASRNLEGRKLYTIAVRVVDIFGNDASKTINVDLKNNNN